MEVTGREHVSVRHALRCTCKAASCHHPFVLSPHRSTLPTCSRSRARKRTEARRATTSATSARYRACCRWQLTRFGSTMTLGLHAPCHVPALRMLPVGVQLQVAAVGVPVCEQPRCRAARPAVAQPLLDVIQGVSACPCVRVWLCVSVCGCVCPCALVCLPVCAVRVCVRVRVCVVCGAPHGRVCFPLSMLRVVLSVRLHTCPSTKRMSPSAVTSMDTPTVASPIGTRSMA